MAENGHGVSGMLVFIVFDHPFADEKISQELAWYVEPESRGKMGLQLLRAAEDKAGSMVAE